MILYRIGNCKYVNDLNGTGSRLYGGRWNSIGQPMVYMASSRALAVLEVLVHLSTPTMPYDFCLSEIEIPGQTVFEVSPKFLPKDWQDPSPSILLQELGDLFLNKKNFLLMIVPSVIVPQEFNYLMNPLHPSASEVKLLNAEPFSFDDRLF